MSSFPSHGCHYKVDNQRVHPRTLEVETKDKPLPASFYDVDVYFSGVVKYYFTDQPEEGWDWNTGRSFDCIRQLAFHEFAVRNNDRWYLLDVDKRSATVLFIPSNALPLTKTTWLTTNDLVMPYGYKCTPRLKEMLLSAVCPRENAVMTMTSNFYEDNLFVKLHYYPKRSFFRYCCLTGVSQMSVIELNLDTYLNNIVDYDFDRNVVVRTRPIPFYDEKSYFITNVGLTLDKVRVNDHDLAMANGESPARRQAITPPTPPIRDPETEQRVKELSKCVVS